MAPKLHIAVGDDSGWAPIRSVEMGLTDEMVVTNTESIRWVAHRKTNITRIACLIDGRWVELRNFTGGKATRRQGIVLRPGACRLELNMASRPTVYVLDTSPAFEEKRGVNRCVDWLLSWFR